MFLILKPLWWLVLTIALALPPAPTENVVLFVKEFNDSEIVVQPALPVAFRLRPETTAHGFARGEALRCTIFNEFVKDGVVKNTGFVCDGVRLTLRATYLNYSPRP